MKNKLEVPNHFESLMLSSKIKYWHQYSALWQRKRILQWKILCKTSWNGNQTRIKCTLLSSTKWHSRKRKPNYLGDGKNYDSGKSKQTTTLDLGRSYGVLHLHSKQNTSEQNKTISIWNLDWAQTRLFISQNFGLQSFCSHTGCQMNETRTKMYRRHPSGFFSNSSKPTISTYQHFGE